MPRIEVARWLGGYREILKVEDFGGDCMEMKGVYSSLIVGVFYADRCIKSIVELNFDGKSTI